MNVIPESFEITNTKSNYTRLTPGKHRIRILGEAISGFEWWLDTPDGGRRPHRIPDNEPVPVEHAEDVKRFLAMPVWNYEHNRIQVLEITQVTIQKELKALDKDPDWGDLTKYDIEIERTGNDLNSTKYRVSPKPQSILLPETTKAMIEGLPALEALFKSEDPFTYNPSATESIDEKDLPF